MFVFLEPLGIARRLLVSWDFLYLFILSARFHSFCTYCLLLSSARSGWPEAVVGDTLMAICLLPAFTFFSP